MTRLFSLLATLLVLSSCSRAPVAVPGKRAQCEEAMRSVVGQDESKWPENDRAFFQLVRESSAGKKLWAFQERAVCDFMEFRANPGASCGELSPDNFTGCMKAYVEGRLERREADSTVLVLSAAAHVSWMMKLRKQYYRKVSPLQWAQATADYLLFLGEQLSRRVTHQEIMGSEADTEAGRALAALDEAEAAEIQAKNLKIVNKLLAQMRKEPVSNRVDTAKLAELRRRARALMNERSPAAKP